MTHHIEITPENDNKNYWRDLWSYRGLFYFLAWRDVRVRYKQTAIGIAWSVLRPLLTIVIFWFIGWLFELPSDGAPRILMVTAATLPWQFFSSAFSESANSLLANSQLLSKVYFPRIIIPVSTIIVCLIDFLVSFLVLVAVMLILKFNPGWQILLLPFFLLLATLAAMGAGIYIAALNVKFRDFKYIVPFIVQFGLYISPIAFSSSAIYNSEKIPQWLKFAYSLNPMVGVIDGFRWCITGGEIIINKQAFLFSTLITVILVIAGIRYFRKTEKEFADVI